MHVLMISLDASMLGDPHGNTVQRHADYARRIGELSVITYNPAAQPRTAQQPAPGFTVYPTNTRPALFPPVAYRTAARLHRQHPADVVTTQDPFATGVVGLLLRWRFGLPLDVQSHSHFFDNPHWLAERPLRNRLLYALAKLILPRADTLRVLTEREKARYVRRGVPPDRITVLPTPTHVELFAQPLPQARLRELRDSLGIPAEAPVLLWAGYPAAVKHVELLLAAYRRVQVQRPDARLVLAGDFTSRPALRRDAAAAGAIVAGRVAHADLPAYYQMATLYVHSSRYEGFGKVLVEALAAGIPVVSTDGDGPREVIRDGDTGLITGHTPAALGDAILALLADPARARVMGAAGQRDMLARFDYNRQLERIADSFRQTQRFAGRAGR